jgi:ADP-ribose pyrophosphatase YjhB (NUDIX family)
MFIKIYIHNKPLYLCNELNDPLHSLIHEPNNIFIDELNTHTIKTMIREMQLPEIKTGIFLHGDFEKLKKAVFKKFEIIYAGGGLVQNEKKEVLMIFRRGFWDLPKGKLDKNETMEKCAVREVKEETGLKNIKLKKLLTVTYHSYNQGTHQMLKESHWYGMKSSSSEKLVAQTEEDILQTQWVKREDLPLYAKMTYPSILDVLALAK